MFLVCVQREGAAEGEAEEETGAVPGAEGVMSCSSRTQAPLPRFLR